MKTHSRCRHCKARKKLNKHPLEYRIQPRCHNCGARNWQRDEYRHRVEVPQMRKGLGRYRVCRSDCYHFSHRMGFGDCKFDSNGGLKDRLDNRHCYL